ncbi:hypothetical protein [Bradyrhizobium embrapense]
MPGLLDLLTGQSGASPFSALYPSPLQGEADQAQQARDVAASVLARRFRGGPGAAAAAPDTFGAGATPFSFAGPGSMNVDPATLAPASAPVAPPVAAPAPAPVVSAPSTDTSSINRPNRAPDDYVPVGNYQMPAFRGGAPAPAATDDDEEAAPAAPGVRAPVTAAPGAPASAPFSLAGAGAGFGDRLMKATRGFLGNLSSGPIGALAGGAGALITGQETDPSAIAQGKLNATGQALLAKGVSLPEVRAAIGNPALMKALIDQYYGKEKYQSVNVTDENGATRPVAFNTQEGTYKAASGLPVASSETAGTVTGPDGKPIQIPPGVNRKEFIKRVSETAADAATGKATEAQAKASSFAARMQQAEGILGGLQNQGLSAGQRIAGEIPLAGNYLQSADYQKYKTAASAFITAMLRQESGAAINKSEFERYEKEMFPQPGDAPAVVQQKAQMRAAAIQQMQRAAGPGYKPPSAGAPAASGKTSSGVSWSVN